MVEQEIKADYIVATHASKEAVSMQQSCTDIGFGEQVVRLGCHSHSAIFQAKNPTYHSKTKYIDV